VCAHYDSKIEGVGAYDNCCAVYSLLKLFQKKFKQKPFFLFSDAEEQGQIGAKEFIKRNSIFLQKKFPHIYVVDGIGIGNNI
jgi:Zn-dependent M28 family amino/carboxypeptidase